MQDYSQFLVKKKSFLPLLEALFVMLIFLVIVFQAAWFASLPPFSLYTIASASFVDWSNYGQLAISLMCTIVAFYLYVSRARRNVFLLAGFSSGLWFLSNSYWYLYVKIIGTGLLYPGMADIGFLGAFMLLATAIWLGFDEKKLPKPLMLAIYGVPLAISLIAAAANINGQTMTNVIYCVFSSFLILAVIQYYNNKCWPLFAGAVCYCAAMLAYALRETYFPGQPFFTIVGQLAMISFCLIPLGLLRLGHEVSA